MTEMERRRFNTGERVAAYLIADGKCEDCGVELQPGWHGHHHIPFVHGGPTDMTNMRALCPLCNWRRGDKMRKPLRPWPEEITLHPWQQEAYEAFIAHTYDRFLCVAWPGTGKTRFALRVAYRLYDVGDIDQIIVVVPSTALREQWAKSARLIGIDLDYEFEKKTSAITTDYQGAVITDAAVYKNAKFYRGLCSRKKTLFINDECHHGGLAQDDITGWGWAMEEAFDQDSVRSKLSLSGTAFRSDNKEIPFVRYLNGVSVEDYSYSYGRALADGVVRHLYFPRFEGDMSWLDRDEYYQHNFNDDLDKRQESN